MVSGKGLMQDGGELFRHTGVERHFRHQWIKAVLLRQLPQQVGQAGADRHLTAKQLHAVARAGLQRQAITMKPLAHLRHIALQRGAANKPLIGQIFQLEGEGGGQKAHHQVVHPLRAGTRNTQHPRVGVL